MNIKFDPSKIKVVGIDEVRPNSWNPKDKDTEEYKKILEGIRLKGLRLPIIVRENNGFEILDGEQRWTACKELGFEKVIIYDEGQISDKEAQELTIWYQQQVPFNEIELAKVIKGLASQYNDLELPFTEEQIQNYIKMEDFDWNQFNQETDSEKFEPKKAKCPECGFEFEL